MIKLDVEEYCHACMDFSPDVTRPTREVVYNPMDFSPSGKIVQSDTIVQCEYRRRCEAIKRYLEHQTKFEEAVG